MSPSLFDHLVGNASSRRPRCRHFGVRAIGEIRLREGGWLRIRAAHLHPTCNEGVCVIGFRKLVSRNAGLQWLFEPVLALSPAVLICLGGILIGIGGIAFYASHVGESTVQSLIDQLHRCATVVDDTARLSCYDRLGSRQPAKGANASPISVGTK
jgi:hypothetical protein